MLLPGFVPSGAPAASADDLPRLAFDPRVEERSALLATPPATIDRTEPQQARSHVVASGETLDSIAKEFNLRAETIAYNSGVHARSELHPGTALTIPPVDGALYLINDGDTVEGVAAHFATNASSIMDANRLYFEPQNFAPGKTVVVPVAFGRFPDFDFDPAVARAGPVARGALPASVAAPMQNRLQWPVAGVITQYFSAWHTGVDIAAPYGTPIGAADAGTVDAVGWVAVGGLRVCLQHDGGLETCYYHTSAIYVAVGQRVTRGQVIAAIGLTGATTGPHVHWEANLNGARVNALAY